VIANWQLPIANCKTSGDDRQSSNRQSAIGNSKIGLVRGRLQIGNRHLAIANSKIGLVRGRLQIGKRHLAIAN
jgi:hypothetical protein